MDRICDVCGKSFAVTSATRKRCSVECSKLGRKKVSTKSVVNRRKNVADIVKDFLGGKCCICGYSACTWALEAHHVHEDEKEFSLSQKGHTYALRRTLEEASKCVLMCANCHRECHAGMIDKSVLVSLLESDSIRRGGKIQILLKEHTQPVHRCVCGVAISKRAKSCTKCASKSKEKVDWPSVGILVAMVEKTSYSAVGRHLGVSGNAVKKRIRKNN